MRCSTVIEVLQEFLDGNLSPGHAAEVDLHLVVCADCHAYAQTYKAVPVLLREVFEDEQESAETEATERMLSALFRRT